MDDQRVIAADTWLTVRPLVLERAHIDVDELVEAAERTKIGVKHKFKATAPQEAPTFAARAIRAQTKRPKS